MEPRKCDVCNGVGERFYDRGIGPCDSCDGTGYLDAVRLRVGQWEPAEPGYGYASGFWLYASEEDEANGDAVRGPYRTRVGARLAALWWSAVGVK